VSSPTFPPSTQKKLNKNKNDPLPLFVAYQCFPSHPCVMGIYVYGQLSRMQDADAAAVWCWCMSIYGRMPEWLRRDYLWYFRYD
jgi:hypothetical protein